MVWSQEKILLKKQVTRKTSSALRPGQKALGFGPGDLGCFLFLPPCAWSTSSNDLSPPPVAVASPSGSAIPAGCPAPDHSVWTPGSIVPPWGALQYSPPSPQVWGQPDALGNCWTHIGEACPGALRLVAHSWRAVTWANCSCRKFSLSVKGMYGLPEWCCQTDFG